MKATDLALGVDIGGTKIAIGLVAADGRILASETFPTEAARGFDRAVRRLGEAGERLLRLNQASAKQLAGVGIGCAGPVDSERGEINNPHTLTGWSHCDIVRPVAAALGVPVWLENDADVAAVGECFSGAGRGQDPVVMLTLGTGVGGAAISGGKILRGVRGEHPEIGHVAAGRDGPECYCGRRGCLESLLSGSAIATAGQAAGLTDAGQVFAAAANGHLEAGHILATVRQAMDAAIWTLLHTYLPQRIILGGGVVEGQREWFLAIAREAVARATLVPTGAVTVETAQLGGQAGMVGAACWAMMRARL